MIERNFDGRSLDWCKNNDYDSNYKRKVIQWDPITSTKNVDSCNVALRSDIVEVNNTDRRVTFYFLSYKGDKECRYFLFNTCLTNYLRNVCSIE